MKRRLFHSSLTRRTVRSRASRRASSSMASMTSSSGPKGSPFLDVILAGSSLTTCSVGSGHSLLLQGRLLPSPLRPVSHLHRRQKVRCWPRAQDWKTPFFVLQICRNAEVAPQPEIRFHAPIVDYSAFGNESLTYGLMPVSKLKITSRCPPVGQPRLFALSLTPDPAPDQVAGVPVAIAPGVVGVVIAVVIQAADGVVGVNTFYSQVELWQAWQACEVKSGTVRRTVKVGNRREFIVHERIDVKGRPVAQPRQSISHVEAGAPISRLVRCSSGVVRSREQGSQESVSGEGIRRPSIDRRAIESELEIRGRFEAELLPDNNRLGVERRTPLADEPVRAIKEIGSALLPDEKFRSDGAHQPENTGQFERTHAVDPQHRNRFRIVAEHHRPALTRPPPQALLTEGHLPVLEVN